MDDPTTDPGRRSWVPVPEGSGFPIQNLPYGVFRHAQEGPRVGVAIGEHVLDLAAVSGSGLLESIPSLPPDVFAARSLNGFLACGADAWRGVRRLVSDLLEASDARLQHTDLAARALVPAAEATLLLPIEVGDYVDFYSSIEHATNMGRMFRPDGEPLLPNWRHLPVGYHGRSGSVVVSGTPVRRPLGQTNADDADPAPAFGPSRMLDIELEVGFVTGPGNRLGERIPPDAAADHIFGLVLVNDWSARDIQRWEYQPLGPFLGKSFATSISPWVVTLDALEPHRVAPPLQDPPALPHLAATRDWGFDVHLEMALAADGMAEPTVISRSNLRGLYWTISQQLAHATSNGATIRPGDLFASGTISGAERGTEGSLIELTRRGDEPIRLPDGSERSFLADGDTVVLRGWAGGDDRPTVGFGEVRGTILPAEETP